MLSTERKEIILEKLAAQQKEAGLKDLALKLIGKAPKGSPMLRASGGKHAITSPLMKKQQLAKRFAKTKSKGKVAPVPMR